MIWLLVILGLAAYIAADAFFDISKKISRFIRFGALPVIRGAWGAVWGRRSVVANKAKTEAAPAADEPAQFRWDGVRLDPPASVQAAPASPEPVRKAPNAGQVLAFLWKAKIPILVLVTFVVVVSLWRGWDPLDAFTTSKDELRAELKAERANVIVAGHETELAGKAIVLAEETHRDRSRREAVIAQAEQEIEDAVSQADFDRLYRAYAIGYCGLLDLPECEDRPNPSPSGPPRLRSAPADRA